MSCVGHGVSAEANLATATNVTPSNLYLSYAPIPRSSNINQKYFLDMLGFETSNTSNKMKNMLITNMNDHVQVRPVNHKFLTKTANPEALKILVAEFLAEYGPIYWGDSKREHLKERDIHKGFLCPRDALRKDSR